ncbi:MULTISPECIES: type IV pilus modification PilV family protein [Calditerrivibrio]|jgi:MSHA pilin protein MshD|uniref:type IV pilus modification PilV family protein n=1 Tax=Calditerrivibrio TaxID=545865 RepID=UPI003C72F04D
MKKGFTLIEIVIFIVVFSFGVMGIMYVFYNTFGKVFDPTIRLKGVQVAQSVMEEIYGKAWDNDTYYSDNGSIPLSIANIGREEGSDNISAFDDVDDFVKCASGYNCPCSTTEYRSEDFGLTPNYRVFIKVSFAGIDSNNNIYEICDNATDFKLITVMVKYGSNYNNESYMIKTLKGNY